MCGKDQKGQEAEHPTLNMQDQPFKDPLSYRCYDGDEVILLKPCV